MTFRERKKAAERAVVRQPRGREGDKLTASRASASARRPWQRQLDSAVRDPAELCRRLDLPPALASAAAGAARRLPLLVPRAFLALMAKGDPADPLLRQVLPLFAETIARPGFTSDPLAEARAEVVPGLLHKYRGRVLLLTTGACAVHCRFCFRRNSPGDDLRPGGRRWRQVLGYLRREEDVSEVILSGGDPLMLDDRILAAMAGDLAGIPHLTRLRVHSRLPVVLPSRVDGRLLAWLGGTRLAGVMVIHANHPRELSAEVMAACRRLRAAGVTVLNQSVLLAGINDRMEVLAELSERLFTAGVLPYYLHSLDRVRGAGHFLVEEARARTLVRGLVACLPGYLVPRLVRERPGWPGKVSLSQ
jgi:EF-P beta-lysylation protein EpmB